MYLTILMFLPIASGLYGAAVGSYIHSKKRSNKRRYTLGIIGLLLVIICATCVIGVFTE